jgi:hypothetical protein
MVTSLPLCLRVPHGWIQSLHGRAGRLLTFLSWPLLVPLVTGSPQLCLLCHSKGELRFHRYCSRVKGIALLRFRHRSAATHTVGWSVVWPLSLLAPCSVTCFTLLIAVGSQAKRPPHVWWDGYAQPVAPGRLKNKWTFVWWYLRVGILLRLEVRSLYSSTVLCEKL